MFFKLSNLSKHYICFSNQLIVENITYVLKDSEHVFKASKFLKLIFFCLWIEWKIWLFGTFWTRFSVKREIFFLLRQSSLCEEVMIITQSRIDKFLCLERARWSVKRELDRSSIQSTSVSNWPTSKPINPSEARTVSILHCRDKNRTARRAAAPSALRNIQLWRLKCYLLFINLYIIRYWIINRSIVN